MSRSSTDQRIALVTGANKGIGYEVAAGLAARGLRVGVGARDEGRREDAVARLRAGGADAFGVAIDVADDESVAAAAAWLEREVGGLDVLVNNAAITGSGPQEPSRVDLDDVRAALEVNVLGVVRVTNAMLPMLRRSSAPRVVNVSSTVGSLTRQSAPGDQAGPVSVPYSASKTYLNALTVQYARELADTPVLVNAGCPGYVATDLNGFRGHRTPAQGAAVMVGLATLPDDGPRGGFFDDDGVIPW